jgi:phosphoribosyl-ATP pyrophosphohydrolase/phosphoribosyl-AMP cyclohydrolase
LQGPFHRAAQKVGEEAVETILAASCRDNDSMIDESADLIYHLMVMLAARGERMTSVIQRLQDRHTR